MPHGITDDGRQRTTTYPTGQAVTQTEQWDLAGNPAHIGARRPDDEQATGYTQDDHVVVRG